MLRAKCAGVRPNAVTDTFRPSQPLTYLPSRSGERPPAHRALPTMQEPVFQQHYEPDYVPEDEWQAEPAGPSTHVPTDLRAQEILDGFKM